jgi:hypothetical protein
VDYLSYRFNGEGLELIRRSQGNNATEASKSEVYPPWEGYTSLSKPDHGRRSSDDERLVIRRMIFAGASFADVAATVGCSKKAIQRNRRHTATHHHEVATAAVGRRTRGNLNGTSTRRFDAGGQSPTGPCAFDCVPRGLV